MKQEQIIIIEIYQLTSLSTRELHRANSRKTHPGLWIAKLLDRMIIDKKE